jgi:phosphate transport system substrate-binding protein
MMKGLSIPARDRPTLCLVAAVATLSLAGCGGSTSSSTGVTVVRVDGSSTVFPITEAVAEDFQAATPGARVTVGISGTGGGFDRFCRGETDVSDASRPISQGEIDRCTAAGVSFIELAVAYDGITIVVNPKNTWVDAMTVTELKRLWEPDAQGAVVRWNQVRPSWPDLEIRLYGAGVDSGTFDYFTEAIVGKSKASRGDYTSSEDDNVIVQGVSGDEQALGYFGLAYFEENRSRVRAVPIDAEDGHGPIDPSVETVRTSTYRPLSRPLFIYVSAASLERPEVRGFVEYYLQHVEELSREVGYVPLTSREYALVRTRFERAETGTAFATHQAGPGTSIEALLGGRE